MMGKFKIAGLIILLLFTFITVNTAFAADAEDTGEGTETVQEEVTDPGDEEMDEEPAFTNPKDAQRAIDLAEAYAAKPDVELEKALDEVEKAQKALDDAIKAEEDEETIKELEDALKDAQEKADEKLADNADEVNPEDIAQMREDGMGWGEICHELGLHPGLLGRGHTKRFRHGKNWGDEVDPDGVLAESEIEAATKRNFKTDAATGHGSSQKEKSNNGKGQGKGKSNSGKGNNKGGKKK